MLSNCLFIIVVIFAIVVTERALLHRFELHQRFTSELIQKEPAELIAIGQWNAAIFTSNIFESFLSCLSIDIKFELGWVQAIIFVNFPHVSALILIRWTRWNHCISHLYLIHLCVHKTWAWFMYMNCLAIIDTLPSYRPLLFPLKLILPCITVLKARFLWRPCTLQQALLSLFQHWILYLAEVFEFFQRLYLPFLHINTPHCQHSLIIEEIKEGYTHHEVSYWKYQEAVVLCKFRQG